MTLGLGQKVSKLAGTMKEHPSLDASLFTLRLVTGGVLFLYGAAKLLGWFGGMGFSATLQLFQTNMGIPPVLGALAIFAEFAGGLGLMVGLLTRVAAFGALCTMAVAVYLKLADNAIGAIQANIVQGGAELFFPLSLAAMSLALLLTGAGRWSLDHRFFGKKGR